MYPAGFLLLMGMAACSLAVGSKSFSSEVRHPVAEGIVVEANRYAKVPENVLNAVGDGLIVEAAFSLRSTHPSFGGLSGLWISQDGSSMVAVSDIGKRWQADLLHDDAGRLVGLDGWSVAELQLGPDTDGGQRWLDSEALAGQGPDRLVVAYEGMHRLRRWPLDDLDAVPEHLPIPAGLGDPSNSGIETLSAMDDWRLFAVAERVGAWGGEGLMAWIIDETSAEDLVYIPAPGFAPTGAGRLENTIYVVERRFSLLGGFQSRIVSLAVDEIRPDARVEGTELAGFRWGDIGENFEAIAARRGPDGRIFLYLLADDNFSFLQRSLIVQLSLTPDGPDH